MILENTALEKGEKLRESIYSLLGNAYMLTWTDHAFMRTVCSHIMRDAHRNKKEESRKVIKEAVNKARIGGARHHDPYELFIDAWIFNETPFGDILSQIYHD